MRDWQLTIPPAAVGSAVGSFTVNPKMFKSFSWDISGTVFQVILGDILKTVISTRFPDIVDSNLCFRFFLDNNCKVISLRHRAIMYDLNIIKRF